MINTAEYCLIRKKPRLSRVIDSFRARIRLALCNLANGIGLHLLHFCSEMAALQYPQGHALILKFHSTLLA